MDREQQIGIQADYFGICKFESEDETGAYATVRDRIIDLTERAILAEREME